MDFPRVDYELRVIFFLECHVTPVCFVCVIFNF